MQETPVPRAQLFYDPGCGPCSFFARVSQWASHSRLVSLPYDGVEAARQLADLDEANRFAYAHLVDTRGRTTGADIMAPLVALALGGPGERVAMVPPVNRGLRWIYDRFWEYRRTRGCAAPTSVHVS